jgi:hypothetical protein
LALPVQQQQFPQAPLTLLLQTLLLCCSAPSQLPPPHLLQAGFLQRLAGSLQDPAGGFLQLIRHPAAAFLQDRPPRLLLLLLLCCRKTSAAARQQ